MAKKSSRRSTKAAVICSAVCLLCVLFPYAAFAEYDSTRPELLSSKDLNCTACIVIEMESGETVFEKNADVSMYPASTTKILTTLCALENADVSNTVATVSPYALYSTPSDSSRLFESESDYMQEGEQFNLLELLYGTMLHSANDGANVIAETVSGDIGSFVDLMNRTARSIGCTSSNFVNPHGYHDENHYTTARDMSLIARRAMQNSQFRKIAAATVFTVSATNMHSSRKVRISNNFFRSETEQYADCYYPEGNGIKTGYTSAAGYCYVGSAEKNGITLISVVFGCTSRAASFRDTVKLMDYGFTQYTDTSIAEIYLGNPKVVSISGYDTEDSQLGRLTLDIKPLTNTAAGRIVTTKNNLDSLTANLYSYTIAEFTRKFDAPVEKGEVMGTLSYYPEPGAEPAVYQLIASRDILRRADLAPTYDQIYREVYAPGSSPFPKLTLELVAVYILFPLLVIFCAVYLFLRLRKKIKKRPRRRTLRPKERYYT